MNRYNFFLPDRLNESMKQIAEQTGISVAEVVRRLLDLGCKETTLNQAFPSMSGCIQIRR